MTIEIAADGTIHLADECAVEDAETLQSAIVAAPSASIDVAQCRYLHGAVFQVLLRADSPITGTFENSFLRRWIQPVLRANRIPEGAELSERGVERA